MQKKAALVVTTVNLSPLVLELLKSFAAELARARGGRASVSRVIRELTEAERDRRDREEQAAR